MTETKKRIIFIGAPGCGKGTQSQILKARFGFGHLSTGDMLRDAVAARTELGKKAKDIMARGELVSDDIVLGLVRDKVTHSECAKGFILDGFPRSQGQAEGLDKMTAELNCPLDLVVYFEMPDELLIERVCGRRVHLQSGRVYHVKFSPPKVEGLDDVTGEPLTHRKDDNEDTLRKRLAVFHEQTKPLVEYYERAGILRRIDAAKSAEDTTETLLSMLQSAC